MPSSFAMVPMVPTIPRYFGCMPANGACWIWSRTLAVSIGSVAISAVHAAKAEHPNVFQIGILDGSLPVMVLTDFVED